MDTPRSQLQRRKRLVSKTSLKVRDKPSRKSKPKRREWLTVIEGREVLDLRTALGLREYKARIAAMVERQGGLCPACRLGLNTSTFDHEDGRGAGKRDDRIWVERDGEMQPLNHALCYQCNISKGSRRVEMPYFAADIQMPTI